MCKLKCFLFCAYDFGSESLHEIMNSEILKSVTRPKKSVKVFCFPDEIIEYIIPNDGAISKRKGKGFDLAAVKSFEKQQGSDFRMTRSGRAVTCKLSQLSLNDSPKKRVSELPQSEERMAIDKPEEDLFEEDEDGQAIYSFRTPKRQNAMMTKASESVKAHTPSKGEDPASSQRDSNETSCSPRRGGRRPSAPLYDLSAIKIKRNDSSDETAITLAPKTPYSLRNRIRKRLADEAQKQELDRLLEDSGSDFVPSSSDSESESESDSDSEGPICNGTTSSGLRGFRDSLPSSSLEIHTSSVKIKPKKIKDYVFQSDEYFDRQHSKIITSNNKLEKLKNPKMAPSKLVSILGNVEQKHGNSFQLIEKGIERNFRRWLFAFSEGYNVMLYGLGSKIHILKKFHEIRLKDYHVMHINGYFPDNSMKEILNAMGHSLINERETYGSPQDVLEEIEKKMNLKYSKKFFILISNLDGKFLQNDKSQTLLSQLVRIKKIHLLATVDHINSPLLWDQSKLSGFNFIWEDVTNFCPYTEETSYESSLMVHWSGGVALSSLKNVFTSLTANSRKVFKLLLKHHLENVGPKYPGMHFSDLYRECRAGFVVSSDLALRTLLTEFMDHQIVKWKKETDHLFITVEVPVLIQFQAEMDYID